MTESLRFVFSEFEQRSMQRIAQEVHLHTMQFISLTLKPWYAYLQIVMHTVKEGKGARHKTIQK